MTMGSKLSSIAAAGLTLAAAISLFPIKSESVIDMQLGQIIHDIKRRTCSAGDVTNGVVNLFTTPDSPQDGQTKGKVSGSFPRYELWYVQSAIAVIINPTSGTKDGVWVRIQALSGDIGLNTADMVLAERIQNHFKYCNYLGGMIVPYGVYAEIDKGGFDAGDILNFVVNYRKVLNE